MTKMGTVGCLSIFFVIKSKGSNHESSRLTIATLANRHQYN